MPSVITITFSPCIDNNIEVPELVPEKKLSCSAPVLTPGGGGINVARVLHRFGKEVVAIYPSGGYTGKYLNDMMNAQRVASFIVSTAQMTRENIIVTESSSCNQYRLGTPPVPLEATECEQLLAEVERMVSFQYLIVSGSFPPEMNLDVMPRLSRLAAKRNARLIVDTKGEPLKQALLSGVFLIKPNIGELAALTGRTFLEKNEVETAAKKLLEEFNCKMITVSMGESGAMLITKSMAQTIQAPQVKKMSTVGAGDSMVAGIVAGLIDNYSITDAVKFGVACGTAATLKKGSSLCEQEDAIRLFREMK